MIVCYECDGPREIESQSPGVMKYKPCARCGAIGIRDDRWPKVDPSRRRPSARYTRVCPAR